nr:ATP-binding protein [Rhizobium multihospitium]
MIVGAGSAIRFYTDPARVHRSSRAVHFLGLPGTLKRYLATALGRRGPKSQSVYFYTLAELTGSLALVRKGGSLQERIRFFCRPRLLIVNEIG